MATHTVARVVAVIRDQCVELRASDVGVGSQVVNAVEVAVEGRFLLKALCGSSVSLDVFRAKSLLDSSQQMSTPCWHHGRLWMLLLETKGQVATGVPANGLRLVTTPNS